MVDAVTNFAASLVATAPSPATSGLSLTVTASEGAKFPTAGSFNAIVCPAASQPTSANAEVVRVTANSSDTFTIVRAQENSTARTIIVGDQIFLSVTAKMITDLANRVQLFVSTTDPATGSPPLAASGSGQYIWFVSDGAGGVTDIRTGTA